MTRNLASLPPAQRQRIQADLIACRIRWAVRGMAPMDQQVAGNEALGRLDGGMRELVIERLRVRAGRV